MSRRNQRSMEEASAAQPSSSSSSSYDNLSATVIPAAMPTMISGSSGTHALTSASIPLGTTLRTITHGRPVPTLPAFNNSVVKNVLRLDSTTFSGDVKKVESYIMSKSQICPSSAELIVTLVLCLRDNAREWWEHHPFNYEGTDEGLLAFLQAIRSAYRQAWAKKAAHKELEALKLALQEGAWTPSAGSCNHGE